MKNTYQKKNTQLQRIAKQAGSNIFYNIPQLAKLHRTSAGHSISNNQGPSIVAAVRIEEYNHDAFVARFIRKFVRSRADVSNFGTYELTARGTGGIIMVMLNLYHPKDKPVPENAIVASGIPAHIHL